tara:strand:+ start:111 stop:704 length:594 start_codon:yes stop_codon:yes gene_type:complete
MENKQQTTKINKELIKAESVSSDLAQSDHFEDKETSLISKKGPGTSVKSKPDEIKTLKQSSDSKTEVQKIPKKPVKPPKVEDKPFDEFVNKHLIPGLKSSIEDKGTKVSEIKLMQGNRPVVGGKCWMVYCEISYQRRFWLCFNNEIITSDKTILLAESNSEPSIVESFLIDEKKTTLALLISRVLQRLNGQKWLGVN